MTVYNRQIATALRMIKARGEPITWRQLPDPTPDAIQPWKVTPVAAVEYADIPIVFLPFTRLNYEFVRMLVNTEIHIGDEYGLMATVDFEPALTDVVVRADGSVYGIANIGKLAPDGTPILWTIAFKR